MTEPSGRYFRALLEDMVGMPIPDDPDAIREVAASLGVDPDDPQTWRDLERSWRELKPVVEAHQASAEPWPTLVEYQFQATIDRLGPQAFEPSALQTEPPGIRMLMSTRLIEGQVDNGGWPAVFYNEEDRHLDAAIEGYRLLGLDAHASVAWRAQEHGFVLDPDGPDDPFWEAIDGEWFGLPDPEVARAEYIEAHPAEFPAVATP